MIQYPFLEKEITIGFTAPSSGVPTELHELLKTACNRLKRKGYTVICGDTAWTQDKAKSAPASKRAEEFNFFQQKSPTSIGGEMNADLSCFQRVSKHLLNRGTQSKNATSSGND